MMKSLFPVGRRLDGKAENGSAENPQSSEGPAHISTVKAKSDPAAGTHFQNQTIQELSQRKRSSYGGGIIRFI